MPAPFDIDFDRTAEALGPYGENNPNFISKGMCPVDAEIFSDTEVKELGECTIDIFNKALKAQFMWNFRTQIEEKWDYVRAYDKGWLYDSNSQQSFLQ